MMKLGYLIQTVFTEISKWLCYFLGGCDSLLYALIAFIAIDYLTGLMCAASDHKLSSAVDSKDICQKLLIFLLVGIGNILDTQVIGVESYLRAMIILFYIYNEGIAILKNTTHLGLPVPNQLKLAIEQLHDRSENEKSNGIDADNHGEKGNWS